MQVDVPESLVKKLWECATPFVETTVPNVVEKLVLFYQQHPTRMDSEALSGRARNRVDETLRRLDSNRPPDLTHTTVRGIFGDERFGDWNDMLRTAHVAAFKELKSFEKPLGKIFKGSDQGGSELERKSRSRFSGRARRI
jgi:hypothetical protein